MRARNKPGTAIAAMMPMIATTISSSISVNPLMELLALPIRMFPLSPGILSCASGRLPEQPAYQTLHRTRASLLSLCVLDASAGGEFETRVRDQLLSHRH